jgi:hypothetical protein
MKTASGLVLFAITLTWATPDAILVIPSSPGVTLVSDLNLRIYGRTSNYLLCEATPATQELLRAHGLAPRQLVLNPALPAYLVMERQPDGLGRIRGIAPALFSDDDMMLVQMDELAAQAVAQLGGELIRLPDEPFPVVPPGPFHAVAPVFPDTFIQRLVSKVSADSIRVHLQRLQDFRTRNSPTESCRAAEQYVFDYFTQLGLDSVELDSYPGSGGTWRNVVGAIRGRLNPNALVIICGHLDATSEDPMNLAPGAEDNGSGTMMALEAARVLAHEPLDYTVKFIAFTGEEQGLIGSQHYAQTMRSQGANIAGVFNFDMVAWPGGDWNVRIYSDSQSAPLAWLQDRLAGEYTNLGHSVLIRGPFGSDQYSFQLQSYRAIAALEGGHIGYQWYHTTGDTIGNLSMPLAAEVAKMGVASIVSLTAIPAPPTGFVLRDAGTGSTLLASWQPNPDHDLAGYKVFWGASRRTYTDSLTLGLTFSCLIPGLPNGTRYYSSVVAFDSSGNQSGPSVEQSAVPGLVPRIPASVTLMPFWYGARATWQANSEADLAGYNVYRSTVSGGNYRRLNPAPLLDTTYRDSALQSDTMYYYAITATDTTGNESDLSTEVRGKPLTLDHDILLVDETRNGTGQPGSPSDVQVDDFYHDILRGFHYTDWDVTQQGPPLAGDIGPYSTIVSHGDDMQEQRVYPAVAGLANYLEHGGKLWFVGWKPVYALIGQGAGYPITLHTGQFPYDYLHLSQVRLAQAQDFIGATGSQGYPSVAIDSFKTLSSFHGRLPSIEVYAPTAAETIMKFVSFVGDTNFQNKPVGVRWLEGPYKTVFFGFPFYYTKSEEARAVALKVMQDLGEPYGVEESRSEAAPGRLLVAPNPFGQSARIEFSVPTAQSVRLAVYDASGRLVRRLMNGRQPAGRHVVVWNRQSESGKSLPAGVYFLRFQSEGWTSVRSLAASSLAASSLVLLRSGRNGTTDEHR